MLAGARARGIADAFEMLGEAAILLDFSGEVLHVSERARPLLGCALSIASGHVVAADRKTAAQLQRLLEAALASDGPGHVEEDLRCAEDGMRQRVQLYRPLVAGEAYQMLAAVLVLEPPRRVRRKASPRVPVDRAA
ncbi:MAG: hypothetical protein JWN93_1397 [Hyphomicrobiales bacterium]|nr:hypothetical protein [Hyphomicrobiales bacterium]